MYSWRISLLHSRRKVTKSAEYREEKAGYLCYTEGTGIRRFLWIKKQKKNRKRRCTTPLLLPSLEGSRQCVAARVCISARRVPKVSTTFVGKSSTMRATRQWWVAATT